MGSNSIAGFGKADIVKYYLAMLMVSGFTDDKVVQLNGKQRYADNLELSAQRALTVTRSLIDEGMPSSLVFAAAFGAEQPAATNATEEGRALNRRTELNVQN